ncbi:MAG: hypothetical protein SNF33_07240 [Candidatus Algichlamydia australiensis]|nr:hypothetical protein [Chlamydiales bacterium]
MFKLLTTPLAITPQWLINLLSHGFAPIAYCAIPKWRKRALSNLALATDLKLSPKEIRRIAKASFANLLTCALEYPKFAHRKSFKWACCTNPEPAAALIAKGQGIIFFCGHQANWEVLFLEGTQRMPGVAIGRPIKQKKVYEWIVQMREKFGGTIVPPKLAIKEGLRGLKAGKFLGIVGDQGFPDSDFSSSFLGRRAFTSTAPALLSYKTGCPIMVATTKRVGVTYEITYSDPIWPDKSKPMNEETERMMKEALQIFETSIKTCPEQWLWQHNRWKQESPKNVYYRFRHDSILIIAPKWEPWMQTFRTIYPRAFLTLMCPTPQNGFEHLAYDPYRKDYRFKLVFNFSKENITRHWKRQAAFEVLTKKDLIELATPKLILAQEPSFDKILKLAICREEHI